MRSVLQTCLFLKKKKKKKSIQNLNVINLNDFFSRFENYVKLSF